jgi:ribosomal protein S8E
MIGRTGLNVRDKYKEMGGANNSFRKKTKWTVEETLKLTKLVEKYSKVKILRESIEDLDYSTFDGTYRPKRISKTNVKFQPDAIMVSSSPSAVSNLILAVTEPIH